MEAGSGGGRTGAEPCGSRATRVARSALGAADVELHAHLVGAGGEHDVAGSVGPPCQGVTVVVYELHESLLGARCGATCREKRRAATGRGVALWSRASRCGAGDEWRRRPETCGPQCRWRGAARFPDRRWARPTRCMTSRRRRMPPARGSGVSSSRGATARPRASSRTVPRARLRRDW